MKCYSTHNRNHKVSISEAIMKGLAPDGGLYMPENLPVLSDHWINNIQNLDFVDIAHKVSLEFLQEEIPSDILYAICADAFDFPVPIKALHSELHVMELYHGPTLAFKDFGARFMSRVMSHINQGSSRLVILVATSGDTGGAVASGFYEVEGIEVVILYPSGGVSALQEKQLTTLGANISALEIQGTFDDCQALVKKAFNDQTLINSVTLSSANSINLARLIPQSFYYWEAFRQLARPLTFVVPSGNFGNLTAGLMAKKMGLPVQGFVAGTNSNDVVPQYLQSGNYEPRPSMPTLSNAMDVGSPSNFARMMDLYRSTWNIVQSELEGLGFSDEETIRTIRTIYERYDYIIDPHTAIGILAAHQAQQFTFPFCVLSTAHPAKFKPTVEKALSRPIDLPTALESIQHLPKQSTVMDNNYSLLKEYLLDRFND